MAIELTTAPEIRSFKIEIRADDPTKVDMWVWERAYAGIVPYEIPVLVENQDLVGAFDEAFWDENYPAYSEAAWEAGDFTPL